ncbi:protein COFACTOR ASSEMBLY OF COMPLEX C SUBUNIT B CCB2, chloroplastic [Impatiens glandulifera]|uniref:protein COFACTOR ASSEMBLY OF COMPLEX C SUBUNIT B CCB2, chloroplastic n=1 Tax=Impatiens glandulifera TaxID=253017 RepID=UPI001FB147BD|nr:protein COFACTOR ASSEMBLY OF COMPLEX C SUBUNIT B CCB2, chloroplastic [Impatiens glandulifera]
MSSNVVCSSPLKSPFTIRVNSSSSLLSIYTLKSIRKKSSKISCSGSEDRQQLNLSVLRFTLGIPGLDESYLPRWMGYGFGSLLLLNHFFGSDSSVVTPAQLRSEVLGLSLAGFSALVPYLGKFLKGASAVNQKILPEGTEQIFVVSENVTSKTLKEDLAWGTYVILRNTNTVSVIVYVQGALCVRGYWSIPEDVMKADVSNWFQKQIQNIGISNLENSLYFPQLADEGLQKLLPKGIRSVFIQPVLLKAENKGDNEVVEESKGFILLASTSAYAYRKKDREWIGAVANKFRGFGEDW